MPERCVVYGCSNTRNVREGISLHAIPFSGDERTEAKKKKKKVGGFCLSNTRELETDYSFSYMLEALQA